MNSWTSLSAGGPPPTRSALRDRGPAHHRRDLSGHSAGSNVPRNKKIPKSDGLRLGVIAFLTYPDLQHGRRRSVSRIKERKPPRGVQQRRLRQQTLPCRRSHRSRRCDSLDTRSVGGGSHSAIRSHSTNITIPGRCRHPLGPNADEFRYVLRALPTNFPQTSSARGDPVVPITGAIPHAVRLGELRRTAGEAVPTAPITTSTAGRPVREESPFADSIHRNNRELSQLGSQVGAISSLLGAYSRASHREAGETKLTGS